MNKKIIYCFIAFTLVLTYTAYGWSKSNKENLEEIDRLNAMVAIQQEKIDELEKELNITTEQEPQKKYLGKFELSFYSKEQFPNSPTATGVMPVVGRTIAVDPSVIPQGTAVEIDGFGIRYAEDTGGAIKGNKIDVFVQTTAEARQLGRKFNVDVWTVE